jgi:hypothetical protein
MNFSSTGTNLQQKMLNDPSVISSCRKKASIETFTKISIPISIKQLLNNAHPIIQQQHAYMQLPTYLPVTEVTETMPEVLAVASVIPEEPADTPDESVMNEVVPGNPVDPR